VPTSRSYRDACPIARSLDVVGERWALLVVRELLLGPLRFADLRLALPGVSSNLLTDRLRELTAHGVIQRRKLARPAAASVYELTARGHELRPVLDALGDWGAGLPVSGPATLSPTSVLLFLTGVARPDPGAPPVRCRLELDERVWTVSIAHGRLDLEPGGAHQPAETHPTGGPHQEGGPNQTDRPHQYGQPGQPGEHSPPDAGLRTDPVTFNDLLADPTALDQVVATGRATVTGDPAALSQLLWSGPAATSRSDPR
jgi:DNA-binding HxlR family transcriptional regulator